MNLMHTSLFPEGTCDSRREVAPWPVCVPPDLTIFIACYNEEPNILSTLKTVAAALTAVGCSYEVIVIDDASQDRSAEMVRDFMAKHPELPINLKVNGQNQGLARNFAEAAFLGRGRYYKLVCGDDVESEETLVAILRHIGSTNLVLPYHDHCEGKSAGRMFLSRTFTRLVNLLSGHRVRYYNGLPLCLRSDVVRCHSNSSGFGFQADLVTRLLDEGVVPVEVCTNARERSGGRSSALTLFNLAAVSHTLARIFLRRLRRTFR